MEEFNTEAVNDRPQKPLKGKIICITGLARAGKNTVADLIQSFLNEKNITCKQFSFALQVKKDLEMFLAQSGFDVWTENNETKKLIRPMLVSYGTLMREVSQGNHWIKELEPQILSDDSQVKLITDLRFPNEAEWAKKLQAKLVHVKRFEVCPLMGFPIYDSAPNDQEALNDPKVYKVSDAKLEWPKYGKIGDAAKSLVWNFMENNQQLWT